MLRKIHWWFFGIVLIYPLGKGPSCLFLKYRYRFNCDCHSCKFSSTKIQKYVFVIKIFITNEPSSSSIRVVQLRRILEMRNRTGRAVYRVMANQAKSKYGRNKLSKTVTSDLGISEGIIYAWKQKYEQQETRPKPSGVVFIWRKVETRNFKYNNNFHNFP